MFTSIKTINNLKTPTVSFKFVLKFNLISKLNLHSNSISKKKNLQVLSFKLKSDEWFIVPRGKCSTVHALVVKQIELKDFEIKTCQVRFFVIEFELSRF